MSATEPAGSSRRNFLFRVGSLAGSAVFAGVLASVAVARELPHLTAQDPQAVALHYTEDADKIDASRDPTHTAGAKCANCKLYQGSSGAQFGPCQLYPGKAVSANGWCMGYQKRA
jgi:High potential iron-sulfur protein